MSLRLGAVDHVCNLSYLRFPTELRSQFLMQPLGTSLQSMPYRLEAGHTPVSLCFLP
jgi:hypothetical protein